MKRLLTRLLPGFIHRPLKRSMEYHSAWMSQAGQDVFVFGECFNGMRNGFFLDIGAHDGVFLSNTFLLEKRFGWTGLCVEANPETFEALKQNRTAKCCNECLDSREGVVQFACRSVMGGIVASDTENADSNDGKVVEVQTKSLEALLKEQNAPSTIDYLSIDIEGAEDRVLLDFDFDLYIFRCLTIERPSAALRERLRRAEYVLVRDIPGLDCFYVHESIRQDYLQNVYRFYTKKYVAWRWS